ncbi:MAG: hypothetical protein WD036_05385 [Bauldia sp.]
MTRPAALYVALELASWPSLASAMRGQPLPADVLGLIRIAAGDPEACRDAAQLTERGAEEIRDAAVLYLQQVLFAQNSDHYRVLGADREASQEILREHLRWLMKWLHPDLSRREWGSVFAERVLGCWQELRSPDRRARYDRSLGYRGPVEQRRQTGHPVCGIPLITGRDRPARPRHRARRRLAAAAVALVVALVFFFSPERVFSPAWQDAISLTSAGAP